MKNVKVFQQFANRVFGFNLVEDGILGPKTQNALNIVTQQLVQKVQDTPTNFIAIRCSEVFDNITSDYLIFWNSGKIAEIVPCSTRAGNFWVYNPITYGGITGTAVLAEGYYPNTWLATIQGRFGFKSVELLQTKPVKIYRDGIRNNVIDRTVSQEGFFGINIHTSGWNNIVDRWSAGCIVISKGFWDPFAAEHIKIGFYYSMILLNIRDFENVV